MMQPSRAARSVTSIGLAFGLAFGLASCGRVRFDDAPREAGVIDGAADAMPCLGAADCDDGSPCTDDRCEAELCVHDRVGDGMPCDDGLGCGVCWAKVCQTRSSLPANLAFGGAGGIEDGVGVGTGFTHRIPSSGGAYLPSALEVGRGTLTLTTNEGDFARRSNGTQNNQDNALAIRIDATGTARFRLATRLIAPWDLVDDYQSTGVLFGVSEDDYVKLTVIHHASAFGGLQNDDATRTGFHVGIERTGDPGRIEEHNYVYSTTTGFQSVSAVELFLEIDPVGPTVTGCVRVDGNAVQILVADLPLAPDVNMFTSCAYAGLAHTNNDFYTPAGGDPANSPWHPHFDAFAVTNADTDNDGLSLCDGDADEEGP